MKLRLGGLMLAAALTGMLACTSDTGPTGPGPSLARGGPNVGQGQGSLDSASDPNALGEAVGQVAKLLQCAEQPTARTVMRVGPGGATLWAGNHRFRIPEGALSSEVTITMVAPAEPAAVVEFQPRGLVFNQRGPKPVLTMSLAGCSIPPVANLGIKYVTPDNVILESLKSQWNGKSGTVAAEVQHFSRYAVAW